MAPARFANGDPSAMRDRGVPLGEAGASDDE